MSEQLIANLVAVGIMLLVGFPVHEFSHALAAYRLGDSTARYMGRLSLDPRVHLDPLGAGILVFTAVTGGIFVGWAKPTPVNPLNLAGGRRGEALVAVAGPLSNLIMASIVAIPLRIISFNGLPVAIAGSQIGFLLYQVAIAFVVINVFLFLFNLLPIPPLDGWKVLTGLVDARTSYRLRQYEQYGFILLLVLVLLESQTPGGFILVRLGRLLLSLLLG